MLPRRPAERPQRVLQAFRERHVALAAQDHVRVLEARAGEAEVVEPMLERHAGDTDPQLAHLGEVREPHPARLVLLAEDHLPLPAMQRPPCPDPPLQRSPDARVQLRMSALQFLENRDRPHRRRRDQHRQHVDVEDIQQRIGSPPTPLRLLLGGHPRIRLDPVGTGHAETRAHRRDRQRVGRSELHVQPHLVIVDVATGHERRPLSQEITHPYPIGRDHRRFGPLRGPDPRPGRGLAGLRPSSPRPGQLSHPDCRAALIQIVALHLGQLTPIELRKTLSQPTPEVAIPK